jgi:hypothetical protein
VYVIVHDQSQSQVFVTNLYFKILASHPLAITVSESTGQVSTPSVKEIVGGVAS